MFLVLVACFVVLSGATSSNTNLTSVDIETFVKVQTALQGIPQTLKLGNLAGANNLGNDALLAMITRRKALLKLKNKCKFRPTFADRRACYSVVQEEFALIRREMRALDSLRRCNTQHAGNLTTLIECVSNVTSTLQDTAPEGASPNANRELSKIVTATVHAVAADSDMVEQETEKAISTVRERLETIAGQVSLCKTLPTLEARKGCRQGVATMLKENEQERKLLRRLERCGEIYAFERHERTRCAELVGQQILNLIQHKNATTTAKPNITVTAHTPDPVKNPAPGSLRELRKVREQARVTIENRILALRAVIRSCANDACRATNGAMLRRAKTELRVLNERFELRRDCLNRRAEFKRRELGMRALEHARMFRLHKKASKCETPACLRLVEREERVLDVTLLRRREARQKDWMRIRCAFVLPFSAVAPETHNYATLSGFHYQIQKLYDALVKCTTDECREDTKESIVVLKRLAERLRRHIAEETFTNKLRRHRARARLHKRLTKLYYLSLKCKSKSCRKESQRRLAAIERTLDADSRDFATGHKVTTH